MTPRLLLAAALAATTPALAQSTGVPACEAFLQAYAQCAATAAGPDLLRSGVAQAVESLRSSYREEAKRGNVGLRRLAERCPVEHELVRTSLTKNVQCTFPAPAPAAAPTLDPKQEEAEKFSAWIEASNYMVKWEKFPKQLADYQEAYAQIPKAGGKTRTDASYRYSPSDYDGLVDRLRKATAMRAPIPAVDEAGARLLETLVTLGPVARRLKRYRDTREFEVDGFALAREQHPAMLRGLTEAVAAADAFTTALGERERIRDEALLASLPDASIPKLMLQASLAARRALREHEATAAKGDPRTFGDAVAALRTADDALHDKLETTSPKPDSACTRVAEDLDAMVGRGRELARAPRSVDTANAFIGAYNDGVEHMDRCRKALADR